MSAASVPEVLEAYRPMLAAAGAAGAGPNGSARLIEAHALVESAVADLIAATERLTLAAERRDYSTGCAITVMNARAELAEAARNARAALATVNGGAA